MIFDWFNKETILYGFLCQSLSFNTVCASSSHFLEFLNLHLSWASVCQFNTSLSWIWQNLHLLCLTILLNCQTMVHSIRNHFPKDFWSWQEELHLHWKAGPEQPWSKNRRGLGQGQLEVWIKSDLLWLI